MGPLPRAGGRGGPGKGFRGILYLLVCDGEMGSLPRGGGRGVPGSDNGL